MNLLCILPHDESEHSTREGRVISAGSDAPTPTRSWPCYVTKEHHDIGNENRKKDEVIMVPRWNRLPSFSAFYMYQHNLMPAIRSHEWERNAICHQLDSKLSVWGAFTHWSQFLPACTGMSNFLLSPHQVFEPGSWDAFTTKVMLEISYHAPLPTLLHSPWDRKDWLSWFRLTLR